MILEFLTLDVVQFSCKWQSTLSRLVAKCYDVKRRGVYESTGTVRSWHKKQKNNKMTTALLLQRPPA